MKAQSVHGAIGGTPPNRVPRLIGNADARTDIWAFRPTGRVTGGIEATMVVTANAEDSLYPDGAIVEPAPDKTGVGLARN